MPTATHAGAKVAVKPLTWKDAPVKKNTAKVDTVTVTPADTDKLGVRGVAVIARLKEIAALDKAARDAKTEKKALQDELFSILKGSKYGTFHGATVATRIDSHSTITDTALLRSEYPEVAARVLREEPFSFYRV